MRKPSHYNHHYVLHPPLVLYMIDIVAKLHTGYDLAVELSHAHNPFIVGHVFVTLADDIVFAYICKVTTCIVDMDSPMVLMLCRSRVETMGAPLTLTNTMTT